MSISLLQRVQIRSYESVTASTAANPAQFSGWHTRDTGAAGVGIDAVSVWPDYTGRGVTVGVFDDGISTSPSNATYGKHGTAVAGIIAGAATSGATGVAFEARVTDQLVIGLSMAALAGQMAQQASFDIANHSWGWGTAFYADAGNSSFGRIFATIEAATVSGRGGLGTVVNIAAGNFKASGLDTNASNFSNDRHAVVVAAVTSEGGLTSYSSQGSSIWVAAPSGGGSKGGILTTDIAGSAGYSSGNTTNTFSGTSAATPQISGVEALMLEANPTLGWRDVKLILAYSAQQVGVGAPQANGASHWNGAGSLFSNDVGFGVVDARAAVRLAETWLEQSTSANEVVVSATSAPQIRLPESGVIEFQLQLASGVDIEAVTLDFDGWHGRASELSIELISPQGTRSTILSGKNGDAILNDWRFTSNAFLGEDSAGTWTVRVTDSKAGTFGFVNALTLNAYGSRHDENDTFVFTDDFSVTGSGAITLRDAQGADGINASAVTMGVLIDLSAKQASVIDGRQVLVAAGTLIENAFGGDGNDTIIGNDAFNLIWGGRGDDKLYGGAGNDILLPGSGSNIVDGGAGTDTVRLTGALDTWSFKSELSQTLVNSFSAGSTSALISVERIIFDDYALAFDSEGSVGKGYRIFEAAFDRAPDLAGLSFWTAQLDSGVSLHQVAQGFMQSNEFKSTFGHATSNEAYVHALYSNVQGRGADAGGLSFWVDRLASGAVDRAGVLVQFSESAETVALTAGVFEKGVMLESAYFLI